MGLPDVQKSISVTPGATHQQAAGGDADRQGEPVCSAARLDSDLGKGGSAGRDRLYESCIGSWTTGRIVFDFVAAPAVSSEEGVFGVSFDVFDEGGEVVASPKLWVHVTAGGEEGSDPETVDRLTAFAGIRRSDQQGR